jgi:hypothetical protein
MTEFTSIFKTDPLGALLLFGGLYGGGIIVAFVCLLAITPRWRWKLLRLFLWVIALLGLVFQGGCWYLAYGIGSATGGGTNDDLQKTIMVFATIIFVFWSIWIFASLLKPSARNKTDKTC